MRNKTYEVVVSRTILPTFRDTVCIHIVFLHPYIVFFDKDFVVKFLVMSEKVCKILLCPPPPAWGTPSRRGICDVDFSLSFYLIFHSRKNGSRLAYVPSVFSLATEPKRYTTESGDGIAPRMSKVRL